ncbi:SUKH-4 family immunity protein [Streptomyces sp. NPDC048196]|uniref:SUKH-4 family immunity protein n=1 Tax=Streptomyces sp. NPDC048196 TaxID=3154712 RepID=UPI00340573BF
MSSPGNAYADVRADDAVERILQWWRDGEREPVAELVGAPESGRTRVLRRVHDALPAAVWVDATGLTAEEVLQQVLSAAGVESPPHRRAGWRGELRTSDLGERPVFLANTHRAGRTRSSAQPDRVARILARDLALTARTKVVVEADPPARTPRIRGLLALHLQPGTPAEAPPSSVPPAVQALALAELPRTPLAVWRELADVFGVQLPGEDDSLAEFAGEFPDLLTVEGAQVSFLDERIARRIRRGLDEERFRAAGARLVDRLTDRLTAPGHLTGPVGEYAAHALPMHAVRAGRFDDVQRTGEVLAQLDQVALLDAANYRSPRALDRNSPAGDAANLWLSGVDSLPPGTWASWLHLMSTVRGDTEVAAGIERSGVPLPWKVRWAHWRPPGGWDLAHLQPGPLQSLTDVTAEMPAADGRHVVAGLGAWDRRVRIWNAATGEQLGGPWPDGVPQPAQSEPLWPRDRDPRLTPSWVQLTSYGIEPELLTDAVRVDAPDGPDGPHALLVVAGLGGIFAVEPAHPHPDPDHSEDAADAADAGSPAGLDVLGDIHGEPFFAPFGRVDGGTDWPAPDPAVLEELFGPGTVQRAPADALPDGLRDETARRLLTETGLPAFRGAEMRLTALAEEPLVELSAEEVWEFTEDEDVPESAGRGAYYRLGVWGGFPLVVDGEGGGVYAVPAEEGYGYEQPLVASSLPTFVAMLQGYVLGRCLLPMAAGRAERERIRYLIETDLESIDEEGAESPAWTDTLDDETD